MFYEEPEYARAIAFEFIKFGLFKNEPCMYSMGIFAIDVAVVRYLQWIPRDSLGFQFSASC